MGQEHTPVTFADLDAAVERLGNTALSWKERAEKAEAERADLLAALEAAQKLCREALPKFDWGKSALDNNAIRLLNEVPSQIDAALARAKAAPG